MRIHFAGCSTLRLARIFGAMIVSIGWLLVCLTPSVAVAGATAGAVWSWGYDTYGQLGNGVVYNHSDQYLTPAPAPNLPGIVATAGGDTYSLFLRSDGTVLAAGDNHSGQLGIGYADATPHPSPIPVPGLTNIKAISAGTAFSLALKSDGTIWAWGSDSNGVLGDGMQQDRSTPVQVPGLTNIVAISAGSVYVLALSADGTMWSWGANNWGQIGDGTTTPRFSPAVIAGLDSVTSISAGSVISLALKKDGTVWAWGFNIYGEVGNGTADQNPVKTPSQVIGLSSVTAIATGALHCLALKGDGTVVSWGWNADGELGIGITDQDPHPTPTQVPNLTGVRAIVGREASSFAIRADGTLLLWGYDPTGNTSSPGVVVGISNVLAIGAGSYHRLAIVGSSDTLPPMTTAMLSGTSGNAGWYTSSVMVTLSAKDNDGGTGVAKTEYNLDNVGWATYSAPVAVTTEGKHTLQYRSTDLAGNVEMPGSVNVNIDMTAPTTTARMTGTMGGGGWYRSGATLVLTATDAAGGSGVATTTYAVNGAAPQPYMAPVPFTDGIYTIIYSSTDTAGNAETAKSVTFKVDMAPPTTTAILNPVANAAGWNKGPVSISLNALDAMGGSGVAATYYAVDNAACTPTALAGCATYTIGTPVSISVDGAHTLSYFSVDVAGNSETATSLSIKIDSVPPTITGSRNPAANANGWNNTDVTVSYMCTDSTGGSGIAACSAPITVSTEGANQQAVGTATDAAGNNATATVSNISIDKTKPTVTYTGNAGTYAADQTVSITCSATDNLGGSGIASSTCQNISGPAYTFAIGTNSYTASATDKAGNVSVTATASFTVTASVSSVSNLVNQFVTNQGEAKSLTVKLQHGQIDAFINEVNAQTGKALTQQQAQILIKLANALR